MATVTQLATPRPVLDPGDILTAEELAERLKVPVSWVNERTRTRAKIRSKNPMPYMRLSDKVVRFSWRKISEWLSESGD